MARFPLSACLKPFRLSKKNKDKQQQPAASSSNSDLESVDFNPQQFNPFDHPDMSLVPNGQPATISRADSYSIFEPPQQNRIQPRSFEKILGYHVPRPGSTFVGPSHWINPEFCTLDNRVKSYNDQQQSAQTGAASRPTSSPLGVSVPGCSSTKKDNLQYQDISPSPLSRRRPIAGRESQPKIVSPRFRRPMPTLTEMRDEQLWVNAARILEPGKNKSVPIPSNERVETQLHRRVSNRSPDSAISGLQEDVKGKGKVGTNQLPSDKVNVEREISAGEVSRGPCTRNKRSRSCPSEGSKCWLDSLEGLRARGSSSQSFDNARIRDHAILNERDFQKYEREIEEELEHGGRFKTILQRRGSFTGSINDFDRRWIRNIAPVRICNVEKLKYVSKVQWTPTKETLMTSALSATIEDANEVNTKEKIKRRINKWWKRLGGTPSDGVFSCSLGEYQPEKCQQRRLQRRMGVIPGKIC